jgi:hypothetical protein
MPLDYSTDALEVPGTLMTCLLIVALSMLIAGWFLSSFRENYTTRPSHLHHDGQFWSLTVITRGLWSPAVCRRPACSGAWN